MRCGAEHKAETRARVAKAAARMVRADGAENVGIAQLARSRAAILHRLGLEELG
jgi:uncharacterized protein (DUF362 family)